MHLDVGRHFFNVEQVKQYLDLMALHNLNVFHWHLTEDQGWRIEIKKYPLLTEIGSKRKESLRTDGVKGTDGKPYGGFYTQKDIQEIVKYAAERYIEVIPEIDLPGHIKSALAACPELGCTGGPYETAVEYGCPLKHNLSTQPAPTGAPLFYAAPAAITNLSAKGAVKPKNPTVYLFPTLLLQSL